jgi:hypothetical protein
MVVLLKDDAGFMHPVAVNVTPADIPDLISETKAMQRRICDTMGLREGVSIQALGPHGLFAV